MTDSTEKNNIEESRVFQGYKEGTAGDFIKTLLEVYKTNKLVSKGIQFRCRY